MTKQAAAITMLRQVSGQIQYSLTVGHKEILYCLDTTDSASCPRSRYFQIANKSLKAIHDINAHGRQLLFDPACLS